MFVAYRLLEALARHRVAGEPGLVPLGTDIAGKQFIMNRTEEETYTKIAHFPFTAL